MLYEQTRVGQTKTKMALAVFSIVLTIFWNHPLVGCVFRRHKNNKKEHRRCPAQDGDGVSKFWPVQSFKRNGKPYSRA